MSKNWVNRVLSSSGRFLVKNITSPANAGEVEIGVVAENVVVDLVVVSSNGATTTDFIDLNVKSGPLLSPNTTTYITSAIGSRANLDNFEKQVAWAGAIYLKSGSKLVANLNGSGNAPVDFDIVIRYASPSVEGSIQ